MALPVFLSILPRRQGMSRDEDAGAARKATAELVLLPSPSTTPSQEAKAISSTAPRPTILLEQHQGEQVITIC